MQRRRKEGLQQKQTDKIVIVKADVKSEASEMCSLIAYLDLFYSCQHGRTATLYIGTALSYLARVRFLVQRRMGIL